MNFDPDTIRSAMPVSDVLAHFGARPLHAGRGPCPLCGTSDGSTCFSSRPSRPAAWKCFACNLGGSSIDLWAHLAGSDFRQALEAMAGVLGLAPDKPSPALDSKRLARSITRTLAGAQAEHDRKRWNQEADNARRLERACEAFSAAAATFWRLGMEAEAHEAAASAESARGAFEACDRRAGYA